MAWAAGEAAPRVRILVVEDEPEFAALLALWLDHNGWQAVVHHDGSNAAEACRANEADLVLLDVGLPRVDGWRVLEEIRESSDVPVVLVTARGTERDKVRGLRLGADDYVTKPFSFPELMARIDVALRRARRREPVEIGPPRIMCGPVSIDPEARRVHVGSAEVHLTPTEFRLLRHLAERSDRVVSHRELLEAAWGAAYAGETHLLQVAIASLRSKLAAVTPNAVIRTVYGAGYQIVATSD